MRWLLVVAALLAGCQRADVELFLPMEDGVRSMIVTSRVDDGYLLWAADVEDDGTTQPVRGSYVGRYDVEVTALLYDAPLSTMMLAPGEIPVATSGRRLPTASRTFRTIVRGADRGEWAAMDRMPDDLLALRIAGPDDLACVENGGCFDGGTCTAPCAEVDPPTPPEPTTLPVTEPCPEGLTARVLDADIVVCELFPIGRDTVCPRGQVHFAGGASCERIGPACPTGLYADNPQPGARIHVAPGGTGNGTLASPFGTIGAAIANASNGDVVLVAKGRYDERFDVPAGVSVVGACVSQTTIVAPGERIFFAGASSLQNVRLEEGGLRVESAGADVRLVNLSLYRPRLDAIRASEAVTVLLEDVFVDDPAGDGLSIWNGPNVTARRLVITKANSHGIIVHNSHLTLEASIVEENQENVEGTSRALGVQGGGDVVVRRSQLSGGLGLGAFIDDSTVTFEDSILRDTVGKGALIQNDATVRFVRSWIDKNRGHNITALAMVTFEDTVVSGAAREVGGAEGHGVNVGAGGDVRFVRSAVLDSAYHGVVVAEGSMSFEDLSVRRTGVRDSDERSGRGVQTSGVVNGLRLDVRDVAGPAFEAGFGAAPRIEDVTIVRPGSAGCRSCTGICVGDEVSLYADRVLVNGASGAAISQYENLYGSMTLQNIDIRNTAETVCDRPVTSPSQGLGDGIRSFGTLALERFAIDGAVNAGLVLGAVDESDTVSVHDGTVSNSRVGLSLLFVPGEVADVTTRVRFVDNVVAVDTGRP